MKLSNTATRLRELLAEKNYRPIDLVNKCQPLCKKYDVKIGRNDISQYLSGKVEPGQKKLSIIAQVLDVNEAYLMGYNVQKEPETSPQNKLDTIISKIKYLDFKNWCKKIDLDFIISNMDITNTFTLMYLNTDFYKELVDKIDSFINEFVKSKLEPESIFKSSFLNKAKKTYLYYFLKTHYSTDDIIKALIPHFEFTPDTVPMEQKLKALKLYINKMFKNINITPQNIKGDDDENIEQILNNFKNIFNDEIADKIVIPKISKKIDEGEINLKQLKEKSNNKK